MLRVESQVKKLNVIKEILNPRGRAGVVISRWRLTDIIVAEVLMGHTKLETSVRPMETRSRSRGSGQSSIKDRCGQ